MSRQYNKVEKRGRAIRRLKRIQDKHMEAKAAAGKKK
jgi:hypothetical protein